MALDDFISEEKEHEYHENDKLNKKKLHKEELCPNCGNEGEHARGTEWRCTTPRDECEVLTWFNTQYNQGNA